MQIVITANAPDIEAGVDPRFGRGAYFILVDPDTFEWKSHTNPAVNAAGGAGSRATQFIVEQGAEVAVSGHFGPNAFQALQAAGISMYKFSGQKTVRQVVTDFNQTKLEKVTEAGKSHRRPH
jgi:predicted Fe-Mo cluster-binding NifX family protein